MVGQWFEFGLVVICIHIKELLQSQTSNFGKTNMQTLSSEISGTSTQQPRSIRSMKNSQADLDAGMEAALCKGDYKPSPLQQCVNSLIGSTSCLGRRMRVLCEKYHFVVALITVNASNEDCVLGVFMLHFFTHNERHRLRIEWGGMRSPARAQLRKSDPGRWANNCWDLVRRTLKQAHGSEHYKLRRSHPTVDSLADSFVLMDSVWWSAPHDLAKLTNGTYHPIDTETKAPVSDSDYQEMLAINRELHRQLFGLFTSPKPTLVMSAAARNALGKDKTHVNMHYQPFDRCWHPCAISPGFGPPFLPSETVIAAHDSTVHAFLVACGSLPTGAPLSAARLAHDMWAPGSVEYQEQRRVWQNSWRLHAFGSGRETTAQLAAFYGSGHETEK